MTSARVMFTLNSAITIITSRMKVMQVCYLRLPKLGQELNMNTTKQGNSTDLSPYHTLTPPPLPTPIVVNPPVS